MKPVAYAMFKDGEYYDAIHPDEYIKTAGEYDTPLYTYTHPAKELTDKEIVDIYQSSYCQSGLDEWEFNPIYFARAILKKAQEK
jgi:hypothetical protein